MDDNDLVVARLHFEKDGVRFVKEIDNKDFGALIDSYSGPGGFNWIATSTKMKYYDPDEKEIIKQILANVAEGRI